MEFSKILDQINKRNFFPIYLLHGEESFFIDKIVDLLEQVVLKEEEKAFNQTILYGKEISVDQVLESAKQFPMGSEVQLVVVKECQNLKKIDELLSYAKNPLPSTILVLAHKNKKLDARSKKSKDLIKEIKNKGLVFESKMLYDSQVPTWITDLAKSKGYQITPKASHLLSEYLGNDLSKVENEIDKLSLNFKSAGKSIIDEVIVEENVGISKDYNNFELQKAMGEKNVSKAFMIAHHYESNPKKHPFVLTISSLFSLFSKLVVYHFAVNKSKEEISRLLRINPFFVKDYNLAARNYTVKDCIRALDLIKSYDLKSKGVGSSSPEGLLTELIYQITL